MNEETYLGDGLYVSFDGDQVCLRATCIDGDAEIFLEPAVLQAFLDYLKEHSIVKS